MVHGNAPRAEATAAARFGRWRHALDGVLETREGRVGRILVVKQASELFLVFCPAGAPLSNEALSGVMSRIDLQEPLVLKGIYTQAMLACLAFAPEPRHVYVMGGGGGRVPLALHHLLGDVSVLGSEIDADVLDLSRRYFGLEEGPRLRIAHAEGRAHLSAQPDARFDHIYLDCFAADGRVPPPLSTAGFFDLCAAKLTGGGVACINLVASDPRFPAQMAAFRQVFADVWRFDFEGSVVLFGRGGPGIGKAALTGRAGALAARHRFGFDLESHVRALEPVAPPVRVANRPRPGKARV